MPDEKNNGNKQFLIVAFSILGLLSLWYFITSNLIILILLLPIVLAFAAYITALEANIIFEFLDKLTKQKKIEPAKEVKPDSRNDQN